MVMLTLHMYNVHMYMYMHIVTCIYMYMYMANALLSLPQECIYTFCIQQGQALKDTCRATEQQNTCCLRWDLNTLCSRLYQLELSRQLSWLSLQIKATQDISTYTVREVASCACAYTRIHVHHYLACCSSAICLFSSANFFLSSFFLRLSWFSRTRPALASAMRRLFHSFSLSLSSLCKHCVCVGVGVGVWV